MSGGPGGPCPRTWWPGSQPASAACGRTLGTRCQQPGPSVPGEPPAPSPRSAEGRVPWIPLLPGTAHLIRPSHPPPPGRESGLGRVVVWPRAGGTPSAGSCGCCHVGSREAEGWVLSPGLRRVHACACVCMPWLRCRPGLLTVLEGRTSQGMSRSPSSRSTCLAQRLSSFLRCYLAAQLVLPKAGRAGRGERGCVRLRPEGAFRMQEAGAGPRLSSPLLGAFVCKCASGLRPSDVVS